MFDLSELKGAAEVVGYKTAIILRTAEWFNLLSRLLRFTYSSPIRAIAIAGHKHPFYVRVGSSDALVVEQVFIHRQYGAFDNLVPGPKLMIDCGGNIGCSSAYFLNRYPEIKVIVVEPDGDNLALCKRNLESYGDRVRIIQAAVRSSTGGLVRSGTGWATKVRKAEPGEDPVVRATDIPSLLADVPDGCVDLLKIDIEWSEIDVFREGSTSWLPQVRNIAIELHDAECEDVFFRALSSYRYEVSRISEVTFCKNIRPLRESENGEITQAVEIATRESRRFPRQASGRETDIRMNV